MYDKQFGFQFFIKQSFHSSFLYNLSCRKCQESWHDVRWCVYSKFRDEVLVCCLLLSSCHFHLSLTISSCVLSQMSDMVGFGMRTFLLRTTTSIHIQVTTLLASHCYTKGASGHHEKMTCLLQPFLSEILIFSFGGGRNSLIFSPEN